MITNSGVKYFTNYSAFSEGKNVPLIKLIRVYNSESYDSYGDKLYDHLLDSIIIFRRDNVSIVIPLDKDARY